MNNEKSTVTCVPRSMADVIGDATYKLRKCLRFEVRFENGKQYVMVEDPVRSKFFRIGAAEYKFVARIDGLRPNRVIFEELVNDELEVDGLAIENVEDAAEDISERRLLDVCQWLVASNLVTVDNLDNVKRVNQQAAKRRRGQVLGWLNPISFKFNLFNPNRILKRARPYCDWLFSSWFLLVWMIFGFYSSGLLYQNWDRVCAASNGVFSVDSWLWLLVVWFALKVIHEAAHGIACRRYGGEVPAAGVLLLLFAPMAFVDVTSMWRFNHRWHRMVVAAAGMYVELFVAFIAVIVWHRSDGVVASTAFSVMVMSSVTTLLFNANPLMRFDGYFLLSDCLAIPNLYQKGTSWFCGWLKSVFFGVPNSVSIAASERPAVMIYGVLAFLWKISISAGLILAASVLFQGAGLILSAIGVLLWFVLPLINQTKMLIAEGAVGRVNKWRTCISAVGSILVLAASIWVFQTPATKSAPAIVQFDNETVLRAGAAGFVKRVLVLEGQAVVAGQLLLELENRELSNELHDLQRQFEESKIQTRIYQQQNDKALAQAESQRGIQLLVQIEEKKSETSALQVRATADGVIVQRNLGNRIGSFVSRGDELLSIAELGQKEVVVSVDQSEYDAEVWQPGKTVRLAFPGKQLVEARLVSVNPRANQTPNFPSLTATVGGPLPVRPKADDSDESTGSKFELLSPRFDVTVQLPTSFGSSVAVGQRGRAFFRSSEQSLAGYLYLFSCRWLESKLEAARY